MKKRIILIILTISIFCKISYSQVNLNQKDKHTENFIKLWGLIKYKTSFSDSKKLNFDDLFINYYDKISSANSNEDYNKVILSFLKNFNTTSKTVEISLKKTYELFNENIFDKENLNKIKEIYNKPFVEKNKYFHPNKLARYFFFNENSFPNDTFPNEGKRLLALARIWNTLYYFYPYKNQISINLENLLMKYIPILKDCKNIEDYSISIMKIGNNIEDGHAIVTSKFINDEFFGRYIAPIKTMYIDSEIIITEIFDKTMPLKKGDIISQIKNVDVGWLIDSLKNILPFSNINSFKHRVNIYLFRSKTQNILLKYKRDNVFDSCLVHSVLASKFIEMDDSITALTPKSKIINPETIYFDLSHLKNNDANNELNKSDNYKNIVLDLREYPNQTLNKICNYFSNSKNIFAILKSIKKNELGEFSDNRYIYCGKSNNKKKEKKLYLLVDNGTISQSEFMAMAIQTLPNVTTIGNRTAGADGNICIIDLPGGIKFGFSGLAIYYPDGRETQRIGIIPDIEVTPTIEGIKQGKDEVLEKAIEIIDKKDKE